MSALFAVPGAGGGKPGGGRGRRRLRPGILCRCCAACCREMIVPINDGDLRRLKAASGLAAGGIAGFYGRRHVDYDPDGPLWFRTRRGPRVMALKRVKGHCRFLDSAGRCRVYASRPSTCRTFPCEIAYHGPLRRPVITKTSWEPCSALRAPVADRAEVLDAHRREMREDARFVRRLRIWEARGGGSAAELLRFLEK